MRGGAARSPLSRVLCEFVIEGKKSIVQILRTFFDKLKVYTSILASIALSDFSFFLNYGEPQKFTLCCVPGSNA